MPELKEKRPNELIQSVTGKFIPHFFPDSKVLLVGDAGDKNVTEDNGALSSLGIELEARGKAPDVVIHDLKRDWLIVIEAVTSHGPIDQKRTGVRHRNDALIDC